MKWGAGTDRATFRDLFAIGAVVETDCGGEGGDGGQARQQGGVETSKFYV